MLTAPAGQVQPGLIWVPFYQYQSHHCVHDLTTPRVCHHLHHIGADNNTRSLRHLNLQVTECFLMFLITKDLKCFVFVC